MSKCNLEPVSGRTQYHNFPSAKPKKPYLKTGVVEKASFSLQKRYIPLGIANSLRKQPSAKRKQQTLIHSLDSLIQLPILEGGQKCIFRQRIKSLWIEINKVFACRIIQ